MRKIAILKKSQSEVRSCVLYESSEGVYVFPRRSAEDGPGCGDYWFEDMAAAEAFCREEYGVAPLDWRVVPDPLPECQHDWIAPVRVKGRTTGRPEWGTLERLGEDGIWREIPNCSGEEAG